MVRLLCLTVAWNSPNPVTGTDGQFVINASDATTTRRPCFSLRASPVPATTVTFSLGSTLNELIGTADVTDDFQATILDFAATDAIYLQSIHAVAAEYIPESGTDGELELENAQGNSVGTLQLADTVFGNDTTDQFAVTNDGRRRHPY